MQSASTALTGLQIINIIGLFASPVIAVVVTLWWQARREKRERKERIFLILMAHRRSDPPNRDWVDALNLIDVVFGDTPKVTALWHEYYDMLASPTYANEGSRRTHKYLELLSEIAQVLGYKNLRQTDIDKFYAPVAHGNEAEVSWQMQTELLRVLQGTRHLVLPHTTEPDASNPGAPVSPGQASSAALPAPQQASASPGNGAGAA